MKKYSKPVLECVELRVEERLAGSVCQNNGACDEKTALLMQQVGIYWSNL